MASICGIYKITSPSGRIYIGQSIDIKRRFRVYKRLNCKRQSLLLKSLIKYGADNHIYEILIECPRNQLNELEIFYIQKYNSFNSKNGLNLKAGGHSGGICSEEVKSKLRKPKTAEQKEKYRQSALNRPPVSESTREKHRQRMLGNQYLKGKKSFLGKKHTEETKQVIKEKRKNQVMPKGYKRPEFSIEWKANMSKAQLGNQNKKGK